MATKKEKHARGIAEHEAFMEKERLRNLQILETARKKREIERRDEWRETHDEKHYKFIDECPICQDMKKDLKKDAEKKAVSKVAKASVSA